MVALQNISPKIDSCAGLIVKRSTAQYDRLPASEKRWQDTDDLMQEGLIAAVQAERNYKDNEGAKYSTFFYKKLNWRLDTVAAQPLRQKKRQSAGIVELDAPNDSGLAYQVKISEVDVQHLEQQFYQLCRVLSDKAILLLVSGVICGTWDGVGRHSVEESELLLGIRGVCKAFDCKFEDLQAVSKSREVQKKVLRWLSDTTMTGIGHEVDARILECVRCHGKLFLSAIPLGRYFVDSMTCKSCLQRMQESPVEDSCFGKSKVISQSGAVLSEGYSSEDVECRLHCVDNKQCKQFVKKGLNSDEDQVYTRNALEDSSRKGIKGMPKTQAVDDEYEEEYTDVSDEDQEEEPIKKVKKNKSTKAKATVAAEPEAAPKKNKKITAPVEELEDISKKEQAKKKKKKTVSEVAEEESGPDLPFKPGSCRRALIVKAMEGATEEELKKIATSSPFGCLNWPAMRRSILQGHSGKPPVMPITHSWKVDQEDGVIYVRDVKRVAAKKSASA